MRSHPVAMTLSNLKAQRQSHWIGVLSVVGLFLSSPLARSVDDEVKVNSSSRIDSGKAERVIREPVESSSLRLGKSDWVLGGPAVDSVRLREPKSKRSAGIRIRELPILRLFVPKPMPSPSGEGKYFRWGESSRPWASIADESDWRGPTERRLHMDGGCTLISVSR